MPAGEVYVYDKDGNRFIAESPEKYREALETTRAALEDPDLPGRGPIFYTLGGAPNSYSLAAYQTPIRNQLDRDTCWAFAGVAALEAAYVHEYNLQLTLSPQYVFHIGKAFELYPNYAADPSLLHENNCSIDGAQGNSGVVMKMSRAAVPAASYAPYLDQEQMEAIAASIPGVGNLDAPNVTQAQYDAFEFNEQNIPRAARWNAHYQVTQWSQLPDNQTSTLEGVISGGHEIVADINVQWKWNAALNAYDYDPTNPGGGHCLLLIGYDRTKQIFIAKNSWGGTTFTNLTYNFINHCMGDGTYITQVANPNNPPQVQAEWIGK